MNVLLCLVTPNVQMRQFFGTRSEAAIPQPSLSHGYFKGQKLNPIALSYVPANKPNKQDFEAFLVSHAKQCEACLLLIDEDWEYLASDVRNATLTAVFRPDHVNGNPQISFRR